MVDFDSEESEYVSQRFHDLDRSGGEINFKEFDGCTFTGCDFSEATLESCKFVDCQFTKCNLSIMKLGKSKFLDVIFDDCKMIGIDWTRASWSNITLSSPIKFFRCMISDSCFFGLELEEIVFEKCKAHDVDFREANFSKADFSSTDLTHSLFGHTNLSGANFTDATNFNIDVLNNNIKRAKFCTLEAVRLLASLDIELVD